MQTVVVTGAGGYVGGQTAIALHDAGYKVIGIDNIHPPKHLSASTYFTKFFVTDFDSEESIAMLVKEKPVAIVHCAGTSLVGPSVSNPALYYHNNFVSTKNLLEYVIQEKLQTRIIFSSSAATYGEPIIAPLVEGDPQQPINPYGQSKLMVEMMLESYRIAYGLDYVAYRYFNVCGADSKGRHGQAPQATHIIARILESIRDNKPFAINGTEYPTPDGTCIRDYVHVEDVAKAHLLAIQHVPAGCYNIGTGTGYSNKQIVETALNVTGSDKEIGTGPMREGDPAVLTGSAEKLNDAVGWSPEHNLESIIQTAWNWYTDVS
jgi:UDP-glucose-4-epimerase GalE